jgi:hypothetical protein
MFNRSISDMNEVDREMSFDILRSSSLLKNGCCVDQISSLMIDGPHICRNKEM